MFFRIMSNYMNYTEASKLYDEARIAADADVMYSIFTGLLQKKPSEVSSCNFLG